MFFLLETVLAPVWVRMVFGEIPTNAALAGGVILIAALVGHTWWQYRRQARKRHAPWESAVEIDELAPQIAERGGAA